jgi:hypothetical protein
MPALGKRKQRKKVRSRNPRKKVREEKSDKK